MVRAIDASSLETVRWISGRASAAIAKISASAASAGGRYERQRDLPATTPASTSMFV